MISFVDHQDGALLGLVHLLQHDYHPGDLVGIGTHELPLLCKIYAIRGDVYYVGVVRRGRQEETHEISSEEQGVSGGDANR